METNNGWISIHRKILDNPVLKIGRNKEHLGETYLGAFLIILLEVNHKPADVARYTDVISLKRGQSCNTYETWRKLFGWSSKSVVDIFFKKLIKYNMITLKSERGHTILTVCNYDTYQDGNVSSRTSTEQQQNTNRTPLEQQQNTNRTPLELNNNDNNGNNGNKEKKEDHFLPSTPPTAEKQGNSTLTEIFKKSYGEQYFNTTGYKLKFTKKHNSYIADILDTVIFTSPFTELSEQENLVIIFTEFLFNIKLTELYPQNYFWLTKFQKYHNFSINQITGNLLSNLSEEFKKYFSTGGNIWT